MEEKMMPFPFEFAIKNKENKRLFLDTVEKVLKENLQSENSFGCKICSCHTHVGSERHLSEFIEAELLFHNSYYNKGFALITVEKILEWLQEQTMAEGIQKILIVGYENFSELYLCETVDTLNKVEENHVKANYCIYENIGKTAEIRKLERLIENGFMDEQTKIVFAIPISTTFTTFQKLFMAYRGYLQNKNFSNLLEKQLKADNILNISLIVIAETDEHYWKWKESSKQVLELNSELYRTLPQKLVYCFSFIESKWYSLEKCPYCFPDLRQKEMTEETPLFGVNRTSVVPMLQLGKWKNPEPFEPKVLEEAEENIDKVVRLSKYMQYKHLQRSGNHFQFYFDTERFFDAERSCIETWLKEVVDKELKRDLKTQLENKQNARHNARLETLAELLQEEGKLNLMIELRHKEQEIYEEEFSQESNQIVYDFLVAPRHYSNAGFVHAVNDCVFEGTARIFYFDVQKEYRGNINAKYSDFQRYVANIKSSRQRSLIRFHFVDDSIYSSENFKRAQSLISTLAGVSDDCCEIQLYASVILLLGRNSKGTKEFLLGRKGNFFEYVHLAISPMRNHEDACTICMIEKIYQKMKAVSATNMMNKVCVDNLEKHKLLQIQDIVAPYEMAPMDKRLRLIITHILGLRVNNQCIFLKSDTPVNRENSKQMYDMLKTMWRNLPTFLKKFMPKEGEQQGREFNNEVKIAFIKSISRPFFAFHIRQKQAAFKFCLEKTEEILNKMELSYSDTSLLTALLNALTDMDANYSIRQKNIQKILSKADNAAYFISVKKLTSLSKGDTKGLLLEAILTKGNECVFFDLKPAKWELDISLKSWLSLYIENNQILVNGVKKWNDITTTVGEGGYGIGNFERFFLWNGIQGELERRDICEAYNQLSYALPNGGSRGSDYHPDFANLESMINKILGMQKAAYLFVEDAEHHTIVNNEMDHYILLNDSAEAAEDLYNSSKQMQLDNILKKSEQSMRIGDTLMIPYAADFYLLKIAVYEGTNAETQNMQEKTIYIYIPGKHEHVKEEGQSVYDCRTIMKDWLPLLFRIKVLLSLRSQMELMLQEYYEGIIRLIRKEQMEKALSISKATGHGVNTLNICLELSNVISIVTSEDKLKTVENRILKQMFDKHIQLLANNFISEIYRMIHTGDLKEAKISEETWICRKMSGPMPAYMIFFYSYIMGGSTMPNYWFTAPRESRGQVNVKFQFNIKKGDRWRLRCLRRYNASDSPNFNIIILMASNVAYHNRSEDNSIISIYKEDKYLCLKNKWDLKKKDSNDGSGEKEKPEEKIQEIVRQMEVHPSRRGDKAGISLWSLKRYCEILNENDEESFIVTYEEKGNVVYFIVKMKLFA